MHRNPALVQNRGVSLFDSLGFLLLDRARLFLDDVCTICGSLEVHISVILQVWLLIRFIPISVSLLAIHANVAYIDSLLLCRSYVRYLFLILLQKLVVNLLGFGTLEHLLSVILDPAQPVAEVPHALSFLSVDGEIDALSVHFVVFEATLIATAISPLESANAVLLVVGVVAGVDPSVGPAEDTISIHLVVLPVSLVVTAVVPLIGAFALDVVVDEITSEGVAIVPDEQALAVLETVHVVAFICCAV